MSSVSHSPNLRARLRLAGEAITANVRKEMDAFGDEVLADMKAYAPRDDPHTRGYAGNWLRKLVSRDGLGVKIGIMALESSRHAFYLRFIEFGTRAYTVKPSKKKPNKKNVGRTFPAKPARPFMQPAFEKNKAMVKDRLAKALKDAIAQAGIR